MALTARDMSDMGRLAQLAANPQDTTREEIFLAVASLYRVQGAHLSERERELMQDILRRLTSDVEMAIRIALAERLAEDTTAPHELILLLADDKIEVARPIILRSPLLTDTDVLRMVVECDVGHQEAVASRQNISEPVTEALAQCEAESVLIALVRNTTAKISSTTFEGLVEKSRHVASLQDPLAHRNDLPSELAVRMCDWVSDALRTYISKNYKMEPARLDAAFDRAEAVVKSEPAVPKTPPSEGAQKLVDKLANAGQLKAGFLLRVLHQGQIDLFDLALARMLDLQLTELRPIFYEKGPKPVALACRAVGIDRCVFATVFNLSRQARKMRPVLSATDMGEVEAVFNTFNKPDAMAELRPH
ncbi:MAG: DUF2336 domain-containing protein [Alphaproteobacteria bacterium]|nr:DUF2336 domain-containing protein [Alphaproteobacteria bacterium]MDE2630445.1 DUF2336 domain-containing protein [Alphaproteobacteria bacterium]